MQEIYYLVVKYLIFLTPLFIVYYFYKHKNRKLAFIESFYFGLVSVFGWVVSDVLKYIFKIPRPNVATDVLFKNESLYSFPSGHTTFFITLATVMYFHDKKLGIIIFVLGLIVSTLRVYFGIHYPIDIACGVVLGVIIGYVSHKIFIKFNKTHK